MELEAMRPPIGKLLLTALTEGACFFALIMLWQNFFDLDTQMLAKLRRTLIPAIGVLGAYAIYVMMDEILRFSKIRPTSSSPAGSALPIVRILYPAGFLFAAALLYLHLVFGWWS